MIISIPIITTSTITYCWQCKQQKNAHPMLVPKELRNQKQQRCTAGAQEVSIKNTGPEQGPGIIYLVWWPIFPVHGRKKHHPCVHAAGSGSPQAIPCLAVELATRAFTFCPRRLKYWEIQWTKWPGRAGNLAWPSEYLCSKRIVKCPIGCPIFT